MNHPQNLLWVFQIQMDQSKVIRQLIWGDWYLFKNQAYMKYLCSPSKEMTKPLLSPSSPQELLTTYKYEQNVFTPRPSNKPSMMQPLQYITYQEEISYEFDSTGTFHWCPPRSMEHCLYSRQAISRTVLNGHVVVCLFAEHDSPLVGLRNLIMPLRASNLR